MTNHSKRKDLDNNDAITGLTPSSKSKQHAKRIRVAGIRNLGNTCFMNSVLQCLSNIQKFTSSVGEPPGGKIILDSSTNGSGGIYKRKLMQIANLNDNSKPELLFESLRNTMFLLKKSGKSFIVPESLHSMIGKNPRFRGYQQHDAHEFLRYVLDRLDKECLENRPILDRKETISVYNKSTSSTTTTTTTTTTTSTTQDNHSTTPSYNSNRKKSAINSTMIGNIFGGILQNEVVCLVCGTKSHKQDPFLDLSLDIPQQPQTQPQSQSLSQQQQQQTKKISNLASKSTSAPTTSSLSTNINANSSDTIRPININMNQNSNDNNSNSSCASTIENRNIISSASGDIDPTSQLSNDLAPSTTSTVTTTISSSSTINNSIKTNNYPSRSANNHQLQLQQQMSSCHLIDCLSSFIELEELLDSELYYCSNCEKKQRSTKRFWIRRLPDVLCLHLKRFRYNNYVRTKIDDYVQFPIENLDMKRYVIINKHETRGSSCGPTTYDLDAFIEHHGSGTGAGHYTAYCRHDNNWFHCDDSSVTPCDEETVKLSKAYILFYTRRVT